MSGCSSHRHLHALEEVNIHFGVAVQPSNASAESMAASGVRHAVSSTGVGVKGWSWGFTLWGGNPRWAKHRRASCVVNAWRFTSWAVVGPIEWCSMPMCYGRGGGVIGVAFWVALWNVGGYSMRLRYGRGCGVIRLTSWGALRTEDDPRVNIAKLPILCALVGVACPYLVAEEVGSLDSPLAWSCALGTGAPRPCAMAEDVESLGSPPVCTCVLRCCVYAGPTPASPIRATNAFNIA